MYRNGKQFKAVYSWQQNEVGNNYQQNNFRICRIVRPKPNASTNSIKYNTLHNQG